MYERAGTGLSRTNDIAKPQKMENEPLGKQTDGYSEIRDIFPALQKYKDEHSTDNLKKLLVEISEFCYSVYASTRNEEEREIYRAIIKKLII